MTNCSPATIPLRRMGRGLYYDDVLTVQLPRVRRDLMRAIDERFDELSHVIDVVYGAAIDARNARSRPVLDVQAALLEELDRAQQCREDMLRDFLRREADRWKFPEEMNR